MPRYITCTALLDRDTIAAGDKFGNVTVLRLPDGADDFIVGEDAQSLWSSGVLNGAPIKLQQMAHFYVGDIVTTLRTAKFIEGGSDMLMYTTALGKVGAFVPFHSRQDLAFSRSSRQACAKLFPLSADGTMYHSVATLHRYRMLSTASFASNSACSLGRCRRKSPMPWAGNAMHFRQLKF